MGGLEVGPEEPLSVLLYGLQMVFDAAFLKFSFAGPLRCLPTQI